TWNTRYLNLVEKNLTHTFANLRFTNPPELDILSYVSKFKGGWRTWHTQSYFQQLQLNMFCIRSVSV
ncbi:hypothetical protein P9759_14430, partial [Heyndrickxia coagulans]|uniref:hypothetical protein n=1 Tax=Heyndrickxia coagulans TaxID=1398 RepID=UPI002E1C208B|nr:hypothetical protein [Heyndrickxia coagulans]